MDAATLPIRDFMDAATIRLISTAYIDEPALAPLADGDAERDFLAAVEGLTSTRQSRTMPLPTGLAAEELTGAAHGYGWTHINAAFCYTRATGNRFNGPDRGAWYATHGPDAAPTARAEVGFHLTRELDATGIYENITAYRELLAGFVTRFHDLTAAPAIGDCLHPDPAIGYPAGQALARDVLQGGGNGVLYPSVRHAGGQCLAAFRPALVQNVRLGDGWVFTWNGDRDPVITAGTV